MGENNEKSLIGFDPLAWMNEDSVADETVKDDSAKKAVEEEVEIKGEEAKTEPEQSVASQEDSEEIVVQSDKTKIVLEPRLSIQNVNALYEQLVKQLEDQDSIEVDASEVETIDTSTLQLLIVLKQTAVSLHKDIIIDFPSDNFIEAAELLGLSEMLEVDNAAAGFF